MSCCASGLTLGQDPGPPTVAGPSTVDLLVPDVHCGGCIATIENAVSALPDVDSARLNLSTRRLAVWFKDGGDAERVTETVQGLGYACRPFDSAAAGASADDAAGRELLRSLAIAGFAAANVMLLSISVWSGAEAATRELFHWISALIALPAVAIAGRPFFRSALGALLRGRLNMDVPISLAVLLASGLSIQVAIEGGEAAFFDAAVMLLFFLLIGRYLDHRTRARSREAVTRLLSLWSSTARRLGADGPEDVAVDDLSIDDRVLVESGARAPVDGVVETGIAELDCAALTGEAAPRLVRPGSDVQAGALALSGPLTIRATAANEDSYLAQAIRLMEAAEKGRARYVRLADRAARIYAPAVHGLALAAFLLQMVLTGGDWSYAIWVAVSVLIITCPCALGLAVPAVQTVATGVLFKRGVLVKDGAALERLGEIDRVVFDKTGTLTLGALQVVHSTATTEDLALAGALARQSRHPLALALAAFAAAPNMDVSDVEETPGGGLTGLIDGKRVSVGSARFVGIPPSANDEQTEAWIKVDDRAPARIAFADQVRIGAADVIAKFNRLGFQPSLLSGDRRGAVAKVAAEVGIQDWQAAQSPLDKITYLEALKTAGHRPLMVGDGVNDAPALAAAHVSMAPASASDIGRAASDFVLMGEDLSSAAFAHDVAVMARRLMLQNFSLAAGYNAVAIPIAVLGFASPLAAAIAMSTSSILVTANALRLARLGRRRAAPKPVTAKREAFA